MKMRMSIARCCCVVELVCNVVGIVYSAAKALVSNSSTVLQTRTNWDSNSFLRPPSSLVDNMTVTTNSLAQANSDMSANYWEVFGESDGFYGVVSSVGRPDYSTAVSDYPNEWNSCDNNTVVTEFNLACIANPSGMPTGPSYDAYPSVSYGCTVNTNVGVSNGVQVFVVTTLDRDAGTYSTEVEVSEYTYPDDQSSGVTTTISTSSYPITSTASSHDCSISIRKTPVTPTYTDIDRGLVDKWKVEYDVTVGTETVTIPDHEFTTLVRNSSGVLLPLKPYLFQHGSTFQSYYDSDFKARYTDVSTTLSNT